MNIKTSEVLEVVAYALKLNKYNLNESMTILDILNRKFVEHTNIDSWFALWAIRVNLEKHFNIKLPHNFIFETLTISDLTEKLENYIKNSEVNK